MFRCLRKCCWLKVLHNPGGIRRPEILGGVCLFFISISPSLPSIFNLLCLPSIPLYICPNLFLLSLYAQLLGTALVLEVHSFNINPYIYFMGFALFAHLLSTLFWLGVAIQLNAIIINIFRIHKV